MNKSQLVEHIAHITDISKAKANAALSTIIKEISDALSNNNEVTLIGFGSFKVNERAAHTGLNPRTGEEIKITAEKGKGPSKAQEWNA